MRDNKIDLNITTAATFKIDFGQTLVKKFENNSNISLIFSVRGLKLDLYSNISKDVIFYYQRDYLGKCEEDKCVGYLMYQEMKSSAMHFLELDRPIIQATTFRGRFLLLTLDNTRFNKQTEQIHYLLEYRIRPKNSSATLLEDLRNSPCFNTSLSILGCMTEINSPRFIQQYYVEDEDEHLFEFVNPDQTLDVNASVTLSKPTVDIDVYRFEKSNYGFEKVIHKWKELMTMKSYRFTCAEFFIQVNIESKSINYQRSSEVTIYIHLSQRRYQSNTRLVFQRKELLSNVHTVFFDEIRRKLYIMSARESHKIEINDANIELQYSINFTSNFSKKMENPVPTNMPASWVSPNCEGFTTFDLMINDKPVTHYFCYNPKIKSGNFFFQASSLTKSETGSKSQAVMLPEGLVNEIDYNDILKGSFIKIVPNDKNMLGDIISTFLDPYSYSLPKIKQTKFLQSIYGIETQEGEDHKVFFAISTRFENIFFGGKKLHSLQEDKLIFRRNITDFRSLDDLYPINVTHAIAQVDEMTYSINLRLILDDKPSLKKSQASKKGLEVLKEIEIPSKGINGVCKNSTNLRHSTLGKTKVCLSDHEAFIKGIDRDDPIRKIDIGKKEIELLRIEIGNILYIKASDYYPDYFFVFYKKKIDLLKPPPAIKENDLTDNLRMAALTVIGHANPRLIYVQNHIFEKFELPILGLEVAGNRVIILFVEKGYRSTEAGTTKLRVYSITSEFKLLPDFEVCVPDRFALPSNPKLYLTDLISEVDEDNNLNTVINSQSKM